MTLITDAERALAEKDFHEVWDSRMTRTTLIIVPIVMVVFLPIMFLVIAYTVPTSQINGMEQMMKLLPPEAKNFTIQQDIFYLMTNLMCPMLFLMIPLMASSVSAACSFVGEKERGTLESLLLTPMKIRQIFHAKVLGCIVISAITTVVSFVVFSAVTAVGDLMLGLPFFLDWSWLVLVFLLAPGCTVFGVVFMVLVSGKSKNYMESVQTSGYIVLPVVLLFIGQLTGLFRLGAFALLCVSLALFVLDAILWTVCSRLFTPDKLLR
ncbi:MAG TPA: ABC transporter permease subunit [Clostridia bacterium]|nr:ABC transporter permease subunit [Clostridia bacterium]